MPTNSYPSFPQRAPDCHLPQEAQHADPTPPHVERGAPPPSPSGSAPVPLRIRAGAGGHPAFRGTSSAGERATAARASAAEQVVVGKSPDEAVLDYARALRAQLQACRATGDFSHFGEVVRMGDTPVALQFHPERVEDFRVLLRLIKEENPFGEGVLLGSTESYRGCVLLGSLDGEALCGVHPTGRLISVGKTFPGSPREAPRHRIPDLIDTAIDRFGATHLACFEQMAPYYGKNFYLEPVAVWRDDPAVAIPGWSDRSKAQFRPYYKTDADGREIGPSVVFMALNGNERKARLPLAERRVQDFRDFGECRVYKANGRLPAEIWAEGYGYAAARAADRDRDAQA